MTFKIVVENVGPKWQNKLAGIGDRIQKTMDTAMQMAAYFLEDTARADIANASGNFGTRWTEGLHVTIEDATLGNMRLAMTHDIPYAGIFESGGTIQGNPLLWIPISGTNAAGIRASAFPDGLTGGRRRGGRPLLFSVTDRKPKYFGVSSVTIPKLFHLGEDVEAVISNFRMFFNEAWAGG